MTALTQFPAFSKHHPSLTPALVAQPVNLRFSHSQPDSFQYASPKFAGTEKRAVEYDELTDLVPVGEPATPDADLIIEADEAIGHTQESHIGNSETYDNPNAALYA